MHVLCALFHHVIYIPFLLVAISVLSFVEKTFPFSTRNEARNKDRESNRDQANEWESECMYIVLKLMHENVNILICLS